MILGIVGLVAFVLALYVIGAVAERNAAKAAKFGGVLLVCATVILLFGEPAQLTDADCYIDWDARSNSAVCD